MRLFLIRHARSTWNAARRIQGWADPPLDDVGREQAARLGDRLRRDPPNVLYTSPLCRARQTAEIVGRTIGVPVELDERLKEHDMGDVTGLTREAFEERYPELVRCWREKPERFRFPGEEDVDAFRARVVEGFDEIVARHEDGAVAAVTHGGTLGAYLSSLLGLRSRFSPFRFSNASLSVVEIGSGRTRVVLLNDTCHLRGDP